MWVHRSCRRQGSRSEYPGSEDISLGVILIIVTKKALAECQGFVLGTAKHPDRNDPKNFFI